MPLPLSRETVIPIGRSEQRKQGQLEYLEPMETHLVEMELGIVDGEDEIAHLRERIDQYGVGGK